MSWMERLGFANWNVAGGAFAGAYALGCFAAGYYLIRLRQGRDIRELGSGSVGARNAGRFLGKTGFGLTLLLDFGKGSLAIVGIRHFASQEHLLALGLLAVVIGHVWPIQLGFRGGKGISTSLGALTFLDFHLVLSLALVFAGTFLIWRRTLLPGIFAYACLPLAALYLGHDPTTTTLISAMVAVVLFAHRRNLAAELSCLAHRNFHPNTDESRR